jgi:hypothetical protein
MACAWATFFCYGSMMVISYLWGQKAYHVPYAWKKLCAFIIIVALLYFMHNAIIYFFKGATINFLSATILLIIYVWFIMTIERKELRGMPVIGKYLSKKNLVKREIKS